MKQNEWAKAVCRISRYFLETNVYFDYSVVRNEYDFFIMAKRTKVTLRNYEVTPIAAATIVADILLKANV